MVRFFGNYNLWMNSWVMHSLIIYSLMMSVLGLFISLESK